MPFSIPYCSGSDLCNIPAKPGRDLVIDARATISHDGTFEAELFRHIFLVISTRFVRKPDQTI